MFLATFARGGYERLLRARRSQTRGSEIGRIVQCAKAMWSAGAPVPTISRCVLSTLDRYIEARAEAAPVLSHVTAGRMRRLFWLLDRHQDAIEPVLRTRGSAPRARFLMKH